MKHHVMTLVIKQYKIKGVLDSSMRKTTANQAKTVILKSPSASTITFVYLPFDCAK